MSESDVHDKIIELDLLLKQIKKEINELSRNKDNIIVIENKLTLIQNKIDHIERNAEEAFKRHKEYLDSLRNKVANINTRGCTKYSDSVDGLLANRKWIITIILTAVISALLSLVVGLKVEQKEIRYEKVHK